MALNDNLTVAVLPMDISWNDVEDNLYRLEQAVKQMPKEVDIIVLPELFTTGFIADMPTLTTAAEDNNGKTMQQVRRLSKMCNSAIAGTFLAVEKDGESRYYNRAFFVEPSGDTTYYDKHHLFAPSEESRIMTAGANRYPVIRYRGWDIGLVVCFDIRFPVWCRRQGERQYDMMICPANWPVSRSYAWTTLVSARAIENQACYIGANRSGKDDYGTYDNNSIMVNHMGMRVDGETTSPTSPIIATFSKTELKKYRKSFPVDASSEAFAITDME